MHFRLKTKTKTKSKIAAKINTAMLRQGSRQPLTDV